MPPCHHSACSHQHLLSLIAPCSPCICYFCPHHHVLIIISAGGYQGLMVTSTCNASCINIPPCEQLLKAECAEEGVGVGPGFASCQGLVLVLGWAFWSVGEWVAVVVTYLADTLLHTPPCASLPFSKVWLNPYWWASHPISVGRRH